MKPQRKLLIKVTSDKVLKNEVYIHCEACNNPIPADDGTGRGKAKMIRVIEGECLAIGSKEPGPFHAQYPLEFCPKCSSDEVVAEHVVTYWRDLCFPRVKNIGSIEFEFLDEKARLPKVAKPKPKPKPKPKKKTKTYMVGIHEHHVSWRRVTVPAWADKHEIIDAAFDADEEHVEFDETLDVPPEVYEPPE